MIVRFDVPGEPRGKGRPRFTRDGHTYTDRETVAYERKIAACYRAAYKGYFFPPTAILSLDVTIILPIPQSASKVRQAAMAERRILPTRKPDVDNVFKAVLDALNGVAYKDDARVQVLSGRKYYGREPGLVIEIQEVG